MKRNAAGTLFLVVLCAACSAPQTTTPAADNKAEHVGILIFGDSGYHPDYPDQDDYEDLFTEEQYLESEWQDWLEDHRPVDEYEPRPFAVSRVTGRIVPATGMPGVAGAMRNFCRDIATCDFGVLVGDNIYPSGATLGADGVDDAQRYKDMFEDPYGSMVTSPDTYQTYVALGNHDWETSREGGFAQIAYLEQQPGFYMDGPFYSVKPAGAKGDVELFVIDTSMLLASVPVREDSLNPDGSEGSLGNIEPPNYFVEPLTDAEKNQHIWLENALKNSTARWKLVLAHHPIWSSSGSKFEQARVLRKLILPAMCKYADAYIVGHEHTLEIHTDSCAAALGEPTAKPLVQILSGAASKQRPLHTTFMQHQERKYPEHRTVFAEGMVWGFSYLDLHGDTASLKMMSVPDSGGSEIEVLYDYTFERRSAGN
tara:strand:- start:3206 stop:4483 length:1278 start_codon:yes stop_codon:yes gene_type:complete